MNFTAFFKATQSLLPYILQASRSIEEGYLSHSVLIKKIMMRLYIITLIVIIGLVNAAAKGYAQKITLNEKNAPIAKVFAAIKKQSGYVFFYETNLLDEKKVTIKIQNANIKEVLDICFKNLPLTYTIQQKTIVISETTSMPKISASLIH